VAKQRYTAEQVIEALRGTMGIKSAAARRLGCHWTTVDRYIKRYPTVARAYEEERQSIVDLAEVKLVERLKDGDGTMIRFVLATLGKDRGYVERREVTGEGGGPLTIIIERDGKAD